MLLSLVCVAFADPPAGQVARKVTLQKRGETNYSQASYSFRTATQDPTVNKNYVELLYNGCGLMHTSPVNGMANRICDLGESALKDAPNDAPADAKWHNESIKPVVDHVYLEEINLHGQTMTVKFRVEAVDADKLSISWVTVKPLGGEPPNPNKGAGGRMGQCGGAHPEK